ncbi:MAG: S8 family peptidase [Bacteroidota bacterium]
MTHRFSLLVVAVVGLSLSACDSGSPADAAGDPAAPPDFPEMAVPENVVVDGEVPQTPDALPEADRYIVVVGDEPAVGNARARAALEAVTADVEARPGTQVVRTYEAALSGFVVEMDAAAAADLAQDPRVESVEPDLPVSILATQNGAPWGLDRIDQRSGTNGTYTYDTNASNVTAYVIDTGIRTGHADFGGRASNGFDAFGGNGQDCNGHGTHVAGTVGGSTYGVAKRAQLVGVRVLDCNGGGSMSGVIAGVDWVAANASGPSVANMSLGGGASSALDRAVRNAVADGITFAVAAGNENQNACNVSPAREGSALTVGASDSGDRRASFSNFGSCVDLFAPGVGIRSAWYTSNTATASLNGTSMASPHVAGVAALYLADNPGASPAQVSTAVLDAVTDGVVTNARSANNDLLYTAFGGSTPDPDPDPDPSLSLSATGGTSGWYATVSLTWTGATTQDVDVYVNGSYGASTPNDGSQRFSMGYRWSVRGSYAFRVCEKGTSNCSNEVTVNY